MLAAAIASSGGHLSKVFSPDPVFPLGAISGTVSHQIADLDHVATILAGRRAIVNCWSRSDWTRMQAWQGEHRNPDAIDAAGLTFQRTGRIQLSPFVCQVLAQVITEPAQQPLFTAWAVTVLAHESAHASGIAAENRAECRAIVTEPRAAELLGVPRPLARRLQRIYRGTIYPYDLSRYRTSACAAGRPGLLVPDSLGTFTELHPLARAAAGLARSLPRWRDVGGAYSVGPLSPCALVVSRTLEVARFSKTLLGPAGAYVAYSGTRLRTKAETSTAIARYKALRRCDLHLRETQIRESRSASTVELRPMPAVIADFSPRVRAFRVLVTSQRHRLNLDTIFLFDRAKQTMISLFFSAPVGRLPPSTEAGAVAAMVRAYGDGR